MSQKDSIAVVSRRQVLRGATLAAGALGVPGLVGRAHAIDAPVSLAPKLGKARLLGGDEASTDIWGYNGQAPGPVLRVRQGDELRVRLVNDLQQPTTIHWHGIRIANAMDGVPGLTQKPVGPGEVFDYRFRCPDAGTFWYHPHKLSSEQVARGLHGILIVEEAAPPKVDQDLILVFDDWRLQKDGQIHSGSFGSIHERAHGGRFGNVLTLNGEMNHKVAVKSGQRLRLRFCNVSNANIFAVSIADHKLQVIAIDGQPVPPQEAESNRLVLASGQRADVMIDLDAAPKSRSSINVFAMRENFVVGELVYHDRDVVSRSGRDDAPLALPDNPLKTALDFPNAQRATLTMAGGAMGRMEGAHVGETWLSMRELVNQHGLVWALDGHAGMPDKPLFRAKQGQTVVLTMANKTSWPHAMHLHGHHFQAIKSNYDERPVTWWRDTQLVQAREETTIAFVADNPGKWMLHCHMLEHHEGGMATWFEVIP